MKNLIISPYTIAVQTEFNGDTYAYLFNTLTGYECVLSWPRWRRLKDEAPISGVSDAYSSLYELAFLVPETFDGFAAFEAGRQKHADDFSFMGSLVKVTLKCPLDCEYCISGQQARDMSPETARQMDGFYLHEISAHGPRKVHDILSGGEPTENIIVARDIVARRFRHCSDAGIPYTVTMKSNGVKLAEPPVHRTLIEMKKYGLQAIDVSIGGNERQHNRWRPAKNGQNSYQLTRRGLKRVSPDIPVNIVLILDLTTEDYKRFYEPIDDFLSSGVQIANVSVSGILPRMENNTYANSLGELDKLFDVNDVLLQNGFPVYKKPPRMRCGIDSNAQFVFNPDGALAACPAFDPGQWEYGHIATGVDGAAKARLMRRNFTRRCRACNLLPLCTGSCRYEAARRGDMEDVFCNYDHLNKALGHYMRYRATAELEKLQQAGNLPAVSSPPPPARHGRKGASSAQPGLPQLL